MSTGRATCSRCRPQSTIPADALDERKETWGRHFAIERSTSDRGPQEPHPHAPHPIGFWRRFVARFSRPVEKPAEPWVIRKERKKWRKKERNENRPMEKLKTPKARFQLSHRACYQRRRKRRRDERTKPRPAALPSPCFSILWPANPLTAGSAHRQSPHKSDGRPQLAP